MPVNELPEERRIEIEDQVARAFNPRYVRPMPKKSFSEQLENSERRKRQARLDRANQDLKNLLKGFNNTFGFAASVASLIGGGDGH